MLCNMYYEEDRLKTFSNWPLKDCSCTPTKMAEAGWYACDETQRDLAQCFLCGKQLDGWEPQDDPWDEHRKHSPKCTFVKLGKPESKLTAVDLLEIGCEIDKKRMVARTEELKRQLLEEKDRVMKKRFPNERKWK